jgi:acetyltransferase-like isoleucine patch superfamily enzyme
VAVHPTAIIEPGVSIGRGTAIWNGVHVRHSAQIGDDCNIGEKSYVSHGVQIGDCVKVGAFVYICTGVKIERGAMIGAGTVFTNERYARAATPNLQRPLLDAVERPLPTLVGEGASIGSHATVGCGLRIGRFAMVAIGSVVLSDVPDFILVSGSPARAAGYVCSCGQPLLPAITGLVDERHDVACRVCAVRYDIAGTSVKRRAAVS